MYNLLSDLLQNYKTKVLEVEILNLRNHFKRDVRENYFSHSLAIREIIIFLVTKRASYYEVSPLFINKK